MTGSIVLNKEEIEHAIRLYIRDITGACTGNVSLQVIQADLKKKQEQKILATAEVVDKTTYHDALEDWKCRESE